MVEREVTVVSWNIDGLDRGYLQLRVKAQCDILLEEKVDVILLQEVVPESYEIIKKQLGGLYRLLNSCDFFIQAGYEPPSYFNVIGYKKSTMKRVGNPELERFSERGDHRHILSTTLFLKNSPSKYSSIYISTSHLQSSKEASQTRIKQYKMVLDDILDHTIGDNHASIAVFGGDTNLRDPEAVSTLSEYKNTICDCWEQVCPEDDKETKYTWDLVRNKNSAIASRFKMRTRFDRMNYTSCKTCCSEWIPIFWKLIGTKRLSSIQLHPSDHFGIYCTFLLLPDENEEQNLMQQPQSHEVIDLT